VIARGVAESGPIAVRVLSTRPKERIDIAFLRSRLADAFSLRAAARPADTDAYRLVHGEGDRVPGFVCDRYGDYAVLKLDGAAAEAWRERWIEAVEPLLRELGIQGALLRRSRKQAAASELAFGQAPPEEVRIAEHGMTLLANLREGQKTGLFLDHRESRARVRDLAKQRTVLNLYGYTGGFSVAAGLGGATHVTTVDLAKPAIELSERTWLENGLAATQHEAVASDVPDWLRAANATARKFDLIVADPPNFAPNQAALEQALESYCALHAACLAMVSPSGLYLAASCSSHVRATDFLDTIREGARRARKVVAILEQTGAPFDHPRLLAFPEGDYLKVALLRVM
jgi:23S rRNA (cytosine1962-C5)-methyltransferase